MISTFLRLLCSLVPPRCAPTRDSTTSSFMSAEPSSMMGLTKGGIPSRVGGLTSERQHAVHVFLSPVLSPSSTLSGSFASWHPHRGSNNQPSRTKMRQLCDVRTQCFFCTLLWNPFSRNLKGPMRRTARSTAKMFFFVILLLLNMLKNLFSTCMHPRIIVSKEWITFLNVCTFPQKNVNLLQSS